MANNLSVLFLITLLIIYSVCVNKEELRKCCCLKTQKEDEGEGYEFSNLPLLFDWKEGRLLRERLF